MAESSPLAGLLDRAGNVFALAGKLGRAFHEQRRHSAEHFGYADAAARWKQHAATFDEYWNALLELRDAMQNPPDGFAKVAERLRNAARIAKSIHEAIQRPEGAAIAAHLDFFPDLNTASQSGYEAIMEVTKARRLDNPFAFVDEPAGTDATPKQSKPEAIRLAIVALEEHGEMSGAGISTYFPRLDKHDEDGGYTYECMRAICPLPPAVSAPWNRLVAESRMTPLDIVRCNELRAQVLAALREWLSEIERPSKPIRAGEAFRRVIDSDVETRGGWERSRAQLQVFANAMQEAIDSPEYRTAHAVERQRWQELSDAIRANVERAGDKLAGSHFTRPESIEDWEHLARIVEIPAETIRTGNLTAREIFACALAWADRQTIKAKLAADAKSDGENQTPAEPARGISLPTKTKRSTERGEGRAKLIAALTKHHKYANDSCLNLEPIGNNELARLARVSESTASAFFNKEFDGHTKYRAICTDAARLVAALKLLNLEFAPHHLFGAKPPGEVEREDDE